MYKGRNSIVNPQLIQLSVTGKKLCPLPPLTDLRLMHTLRLEKKMCTLILLSLAGSLCFVLLSLTAVTFATIIAARK